ncbi:hypothetical protein H5410_016548 [Solanum commersonii]|uniref:Uncharacterized protein n=1 Tax=Solanum commersonii TaxID=4109 RepID=A0A9J5ZXP7_SOLCO|nr:hypothetical protein H5410_016548 [Solanum commersonii]
MIARRSLSNTRNKSQHFLYPEMENYLEPSHGKLSAHSRKIITELILGIGPVEMIYQAYPGGDDNLNILEVGKHKD